MSQQQVVYSEDSCWHAISKQDIGISYKHTHSPNTMYSSIIDTILENQYVLFNYSPCDF